MKRKVWKKGLANELEAWPEWIKTKGKLYEKRQSLKESLVSLVGDKKDVKIANLGSGPISLIGDFLDNVKVEIEASDILADEYNKLLNQFEIKPIVPVKKEDMTNLSYADEEFDIVHCANALDHSHDPYKALNEMVRICKKGGSIYLFHIAHEGQRLKYRGLHSWNIDMTEESDCIFWTKEEGPKTNTFLLSEIYPGFITTLKPAHGGTFITSILQEK